ncbi:hypothetical protein PCASD_07508 [Puccinia coronata f. sp. avenae]|uniref:Thioredoxin domain-containing protein n=1 Tax=Puccinia coronata f. sp. avenae TaxID=200324 RepID=A0A2N5V074_9BASI|nr:hypothetical protein PCASD_07508 [Puccinia coronata f. sp. avenae]
MRMAMRSSIRATRWSMSVHLLIGLLFVCLHHHVHAHQNQQIIVDFDQQDQHPIPTTRTTSDIPATVPTGLPAQLIKKVTGWNDTLVAKLLGQISPRPPHPFVVPITDENLENVIESEIDSIHPGWGSDEDTVWVISVVATDRSSILFDEQFDKLASNSSLAIHPVPPKQREDEPEVVQKDASDPYLFKPQLRFARIDYMGSTDFILTRWLIFKCPVLVVITKRGKEIRFFKTGAVPPTAEHLGSFLREERYLLKPVWNSTFSQGNSGQWVVILMGKGFQGFHMLTDRVPGWLLMIVTSMLGTSLMQWLHKSTPKSKSIRTTNTSSTEGSSKQSLSHPSSDPVASRELKKELADASVQLAQLTAQKRGASSKTQSTTTQRRK